MEGSTGSPSANQSVDRPNWYRVWPEHPHSTNKRGYCLNFVAHLPDGFVPRKNNAIGEGREWLKLRRQLRQWKGGIFE